MRTLTEIENELKVLKDMERVAVHEITANEKYEFLLTVLNLSAVLAFCDWLFNKTEMSFSTLMNLSEVGRKGIEKGVSIEDIMDFTHKKVDEFERRKKNV